MGRLIKYMQAMRGQQLWQSEEVSLTRPHVPSAAAIDFLVTSLVPSPCLLVLTLINHRWNAQICCSSEAELWETSFAVVGDRWAQCRWISWHLRRI